VRKHIITIAAVFVVIAVLGTVALTGLDIGDFHFPGVGSDNGIVLGLDLQGGASITYQAVGVDNISRSDMDSVVTIFGRRLDNQNFTERRIVQSGQNRITIEIPGQNPDDDLVALLGSTARLSFRHNGEEIIGAEQVRNARADWQNQEFGARQPVVQLAFDQSAQAAFFAATSAAAAQPQGSDANRIFIYLDEDQISAPFVNEPINSNTAVITMGGEGDGWNAARNLAELINSGVLPFTLELVEMRQVSATLGEEALHTSIRAGLIGLILLALFMIIYYRVPGIVAAVVLTLYVTLSITLMNILSVNLTLPGIAGIILSIGMATDAEIVIFERVKYELRSGKTLRAAVDSGFKRARSAIIDTCLTTMISAGVLYFMGTGPIQGFAVTLFLGVMVSMFTALVITRLMLRAVVGLRITNPRLYGVSELSGASTSKEVA